MNKVKYIGYGCINSQLDKNVIEIKSTKTYKALRAAFLDEIVIEVLPAFTIDRPKLESLVNKYKSFMNNPTEFIIFVVPSVETLGGNLEIAISNYNIIIESFDIIILNRPDLSTCSLSGEVFVDLATDIPANNCLTQWVNGVASTGTFTKAAAMTSLTTGVSGIPEGWTVKNYGE